MPELPEVETTRRGIEPHLCGRTISQVAVRERRLRWPLESQFETCLEQRSISAVRRRAKYLLIDTERARRGQRAHTVEEKEANKQTLIVHLGMSGSLRLVTPGTELRTHDHVCVQVDRRGQRPLELRFHDPRRFGSMHLCAEPERHMLLASLGPEPLGEDFDGAYLHARARGKRVAIKNLVMDAKVVVGVGNIYAAEALFDAGIHPARPAGRISRKRLDALTAAIKQILGDAIEAGGTTLRDFVNSDGTPGYFAQQLRVYGSAGEACRRCGEAVRSRVIGQRSSFFCASCQR